MTFAFSSVFILLLWTSVYKSPVLGTCATFSATALLAQIKKGDARRGGAKVKKMARWQWRENKMELRSAISAPFLDQTVQKNPEPELPGGGVMDGTGGFFFVRLRLLLLLYCTVKYDIFTGT